MESSLAVGDRARGTMVSYYSQLPQMCAESHIAIAISFIVFLFVSSNMGLPPASPRTTGRYKYQQVKSWGLLRLHPKDNERRN